MTNDINSWIGNKLRAAQGLPPFIYAAKAPVRMDGYSKAVTTPKARRELSDLERQQAEHLPPLSWETPIEDLPELRALPDSRKAEREMLAKMSESGKKKQREYKNWEAYPEGSVNETFYKIPREGEEGHEETLALTQGLNTLYSNLMGLPIIPLDLTGYPGRVVTQGWEEAKLLPGYEALRPYIDAEAGVNPAYHPEGFGNKVRYNLAKHADIGALGGYGLGALTRKKLLRHAEPNPEYGEEVFQRNLHHQRNLHQQTDSITRNVDKTGKVMKLAQRLKSQYSKPEPIPLKELNPIPVYPEDRLPFLFDPLESKLQLTAGGKKMNPKQIREYLTKQQNQKTQLGYGLGSVKLSVMNESGMDLILNGLDPKKKIDPSTLLRDQRYTADHIHRSADIKEATSHLRERYGSNTVVTQYTVDPNTVGDPWVQASGIGKDHPQYLLYRRSNDHTMYPDVRDEGVVTAAWARGADHMAKNPKSTGHWEDEYMSVDGVQEIQSDVVQNWEKRRAKANKAAKKSFDVLYDVALRKNPEALRNSKYSKQLAKMRKQDAGSVDPKMWDLLAKGEHENWSVAYDEVAQHQLGHQRLRAMEIKQAKQKMLRLAEAAKLADETGIDLYSSTLGHVTSSYTKMGPHAPFEALYRPSDTPLNQYDDVGLTNVFEPNSPRIIRVPNYELGSTVSAAQEALARTRSRIDVAIRGPMSPDWNITRKSFIAKANDSSLTEFAPYREIGNSHYLVQQYRDKVIKEFRKTHDMRKFRTATKEETPVGTIWGDHRDKYEKIYQIENQTDDFIASYWPDIYKDALIAKRLRDIAIKSQKLAEKEYPLFDATRAEGVFANSDSMNQASRKPKMAHRYYSEMLAKIMQRGMMRKKPGLVWPMGEAKSKASGYAGAEQVYGKRGKIRKAANQKIKEMGGAPPNLKDSPTIEVLERTPEGGAYEMQEFNYMEYTPEMVEHARKYGIPLSAVAAAPLAEDDSPQLVTPQDILDKIK